MINAIETHLNILLFVLCKSINRESSTKCNFLETIQCFAYLVNITGNGSEEVGKLFSVAECDGC
jgi:hypothetical protein